MIDSAGVKLWGREWNKEYVCVLLHRNIKGTSTRPSTVQPKHCNSRINRQIVSKVFPLMKASIHDGRLD